MKTKKNTERSKPAFLAQSALIAALYIALTLLSQLLGIASGAIQLRLSEALTVLPFFTPAAVPGLFVGCMLANLLTGCAIWDVVFGSIATLIGAIGTYLLRKKRFLAAIPPILANMAILPFVLLYVYGVPETLPYLILTIGIGEILSCGVLGTALQTLLIKSKVQL